MRIDNLSEENTGRIKGINPRDRTEEFIFDDEGNLFNLQGDKIGKIRYIKSRQVIKITSEFKQEIKIVKQKKIKK